MVLKFTYCHTHSAVLVEKIAKVPSRFQGKDHRIYHPVGRVSRSRKSMWDGIILLRPSLENTVCSNICEVKVVQSYPTLCDPADIQSMEFSRPEYWNG